MPNTASTKNTPIAAAPTQRSASHESENAETSRDDAERADRRSAGHAEPDEDGPRCRPVAVLVGSVEIVHRAVTPE